MLDVMPMQVRLALKSVNINSVCEIRLRAGGPVVLNVGTEGLFLCPYGTSRRAENAVKVSAKDISDTVYGMCERSVYSYTDKICKGFISLSGGVRVGICGECVVEGGEIKNIKNISSLNVRLPRRVKGCADRITELYSDGVKNTLIISPPGVGKTTMIRDIAEQLSLKKDLSVLVCDERMEIFPLMQESVNVDCITYSPKIFAFENAVRAMAPDVIVTDEISGEDDVKALKKASLCGVRVVASCHGECLDDVLRGEGEPVKDVFNYFVILDKSKGRGTLKGIFDREGREIKSAR